MELKYILVLEILSVLIICNLQFSEAKPIDYQIQYVFERIETEHKWYHKMAKLYKTFTELKIFDPLQIRIKYVKKVINGVTYLVPEDETKNHYFIG